MLAVPSLYEFSLNLYIPGNRFLFYADNSFKVSKGKGKGSIITKHGIAFTIGWAWSPHRFLSPSMVVATWVSVHFHFQFQ